MDPRLTSERGFERRAIRQVRLDPIRHRIMRDRSPLLLADQFAVLHMDQRGPRLEQIQRDFQPIRHTRQVRLGAGFLHQMLGNQQPAQCVIERIRHPFVQVLADKIHAPPV